ncbi:PEP-CTERM sorting domain-containing protein [Accumulibacter sp.]|uniref:PEP-CTERM sorting domain-containing protein n=1 Tax=Accumulibacter sp. TaxID=2053492 RepID=UPI00263755C6|nr:PEP-CTERM sorting domain-containing protein [Accumulibacter sp.]
MIAAGRSYINTVDTVGGKEGKGVTVKFNADGSAGGGVGGAVWSRQTPAAPGGFPYGGHEWLTGVTTAFEGGQTRLYTAGVGERVGFTSEWGLFVTKLDDSGNILWSRNDFSPTNAHNRPSITAIDNGVYVASRNDTSGIHPYLKKYNQDGNLVWSKTSAASGEYLGVASAGGNVYAVGQTNPETANPDFLIESWDGAGNLLWSKTYDRGSAEDILNGVVYRGGRLFAVGSTKGGSAGGTDGILLEIDALTGNLIDSSLWGGAADDSFSGLAIAGARLYAVGATRSFGAGGSDIALTSFALPSASVPEPATLLLTSLGMAGLLAARRRDDLQRGVEVDLQSA